MKLLDSLSNEDFDCIVYHGLAKGGGEKVVDKLKEFFPDVVYLSHKSLKVRDILQCRSLLFTSGPRDALFIFISFLLRKKVSVYVQVPFYKSVSLARPIHLILCCAYYAIINFLRVHSNSLNSSKYILGCTVILPITQKELLLLNSVDKKTNIISDKYYTACRLNDEVGLPSRSIESITQFLELNKNKNLYHFGEISKNNFDILSSYNNYHFLGYDQYWTKKVDGKVIFFSNFEGFGLAAFEAACEGFPVLVSRGFPEDLVNLSEFIEYFNE